jgi:hypothetical protein
MSKTTTEDFEKALDEKIEKFLSEILLSPTSRYEARLLLHDLVRADVAGFVHAYVSHATAHFKGTMEREFEFKGEEVECELSRKGIPHAPHIVGGYMTVRYGALDYYCLGRPGYVTLWGYTIHVQIEVKRRGWRAEGRVRVEVTA